MGPAVKSQLSPKGRSEREARYIRFALVPTADRSSDPIIHPRPCAARSRRTPCARAKWASGRLAMREARAHAGQLKKRRALRSRAAGPAGKSAPSRNSRSVSNCSRSQSNLSRYRTDTRDQLGQVALRGSTINTEITNLIDIHLCIRPRLSDVVRCVSGRQTIER